ARLAEVDPAERGAVEEPERDQIPRLADRVHLRLAHGARRDQLDERGDVVRRRDRRGRRRRRLRRLAGSDVDRANLAHDVVEVGADLRARIAPGLIEEDAVPPDGGEAEVGWIAL